MTTEKAEILQVTDHRLSVAGNRHRTCGKCAMRQGCGQYLLRQRNKLHVDFDFSTLSPAEQAACRALRPGDEIDMHLTGNRLTRLVLWFYGLPLAGVVMGAAIGTLLGFSELNNIFCATAGLVLGIRLARHYLGEKENTVYFLPELKVAAKGNAAYYETSGIEESQ
jgi:positive regulator of sigma E activity